MCLSIPSRVVSIEDDGTATVETMGIQRTVSLDLMADEVLVGDYLLIHIGFAMSKIDQEDALHTLNLYQEMIDRLEDEEKRRLIDEDERCSNREIE